MLAVLLVLSSMTRRALKPLCQLSSKATLEKRTSMIRFINVSLMRGTKPLLESVDLTLNPGDKIGLIGANGAGKSSLFGMLRGELHADQGEIDFPAKWRMAYVAQETPPLDRAALDYAIDGDVNLRKLEAELARLETRTKPHRQRHRHRRDLQRAGRRRRLHRAVARRTAAARPGLLARPDAAAGRQLLRRLAHAPEPGAGADVPFRPAAARRTDQPPGPRRHHLAGRLAETLRRHPDHHLARPRFPRRDRAT